MYCIKNHHSLFLRKLYPILFLVLAMSFTTTVVQAEDASQYPIRLSCLPDTTASAEAEATEDTASIQGVNFLCTVINTDENQSFEVVLLGKQGGADGAARVSTRTLSLNGGATAAALLRFPAIFRSGAYRYDFSLTDTLTRQPRAMETSYTQKISNGVYPYFSSVKVDHQPAWQQPSALGVVLAYPKGQRTESLPLYLSWTMQDHTGRQCASLVKHQLVRGTEEVLSGVLPPAGKCTNAFVVSLEHEDGALVDQKILAASLSLVPETSQAMLEQTFFSTVPKMLVVGLILTSIMALALIGYFLIRTKK